MKPSSAAQIMTFEASAFELMALSGLLLVYMGHVHRLKRPSREELWMAQTLNGFYRRIVRQLPARKSFA
jgi:hypothetical protein